MESQNSYGDVIENFFEGLWKPKVTYQEERRKALTGKKPPVMDPTRLRLSYRMNDVPSDRRNLVSVSGTTSNRVYCSRSPLGKLELSCIPHMKINIPFRGYYLLLRTLEKPKRLIGVITIVEDHEGNAFRFSAYNLLDARSSEQFRDLLPVGTVFILKEPFLKAIFDGGFAIRCDSPSDIIIIRRHHTFYNMFRDIKWKNKIEEISKKEPATSSAWKELGNGYYTKKRYLQALECYLMALETCDTIDSKAVVVINLNLAATYLQTGYFEDTMKHADIVLKMDPKNPKALFRAGRAHYELRQFDEALDCFSRHLSEDPTNVDSTTQAERCKQRLQEKTGKFDFKKLYLATVDDPKKPMDCADYNYCGLEKKYDTQEGRVVVVAAEDIKPGTLLVVSKALFVAFKDKSEIVLQWQADKTIINAETMKLVQEVSSAVIKNPETIGRLVYDLPVDDYITNSIAPQRYCNEDTKEEPISDVERIRKIILSNGIFVEPNDFSLNGKSDRGIGLFFFPSFMPHSCVGNAWLSMFNDVVVIHASRHIKAGEIVNISRCNPVLPFSERQNILLSWEKICLCKLCDIDKKESLEKRKERDEATNLILDLLHSYLRSGHFEGKSTDRMWRYVQIIEDSYRKCGRNELKLNLVYAYTCQACFFMNLDRNSQKPLKLLWKAIEAAGFDPEQLLKWSKGKNSFNVPANAFFSGDFLLTLLCLVKCFLERGKLKDAKKWWSVVRTAENVLTGCDADILREKYNLISSEQFEKLLA